MDGGIKNLVPDLEHHGSLKKARDSLFVLGTANGGSGDDQMIYKLQQAASH